MTAEFNKFSFTVKNVSKNVHSPQCLYKMMKVKLGKSLLSYTPRRKTSGRLLYRNGIDFLNSFHLVVHCNTVDKMRTETNILYGKNVALISEKNRKMQRHEILTEAVEIMRPCHKTYVPNKISPNELPNINNFVPIYELKQPPHTFLWNFIYRLSATGKEVKDWNKTVGSWNNHYIEDPVNIFRLFPRLYISSCILNTQNSQCVQLLHLLMTDNFQIHHLLSCL